MSSGHSIKWDRDICVVRGDPDRNMSILQFRQDHGSVEITIVPKDGNDMIAYLSPVEAMSLSKRLRELAITALESSI